MTENNIMLYVNYIKKKRERERQAEELVLPVPCVRSLEFSTTF